MCLAAGVALYATLALSSMRVKSATYDEPLHLTAGYTYLARGDYRVNPQHPPLAKTLAAAGLLGLDVTFRPDDPAWREGYQNKSWPWAACWSYPCSSGRSAWPVLAVSATNLRAVRLDQGRRLMRKLREQEPIAMIGYSILVYRADFSWTPE